jgi:hypothetical protein
MCFPYKHQFLCTSISIQFVNLLGIKPSTLHYTMSIDTNFYALALAFNLWDYQASSLNFALHGEYILHKNLFLKCTSIDLFEKVHVGISKNIHPRAVVLNKEAKCAWIVAWLQYLISSICSRFDLETFHVFKTLCAILQGDCGIEIDSYFDGVKHRGLGRHKWKALFHVISYCRTMSSWLFIGRHCFNFLKCFVKLPIKLLSLCHL